MNGKERIQATFEGRSTDRVPVYQLSASCGVASELLGRDAYVGFGIQQWREAATLWDGPDAHAEFLQRTYQDTLAINRCYGNDLYRFVYPRAPGRPTRKVDKHTYVYESGPEKNWRALRELGDEAAIRMGGGAVGIGRQEWWLEAVALRPDLVARSLDLQVASARRSVGRRRSLRGVRCRRV
ncbi:MAG: hypothetical protein O2782_07960 [bacterium]|nr:hypothetical protein [bacterium]